MTPDGKRILAEGIHLKIKGSEKICMIGANGAGKTTLLKKIAEELLNRNDIKAEYMPQTYEDLLDWMLHRLITLIKQEIKKSVQELEHTLVHLNTHQMKWSIRFGVIRRTKGESASLEDELKWCKCSYSG